MFTQAILIGSLALGSYASFGSSSSNALFGAGSSSSTTQSSVNAQTTVNLFIDGQAGDGYIGSVVSADSCTTTYALACTEGGLSSGLLTATCNPGETAYATYGPGYFELSTQVNTEGVVATLVESCSLGGTTLAVCSASIYASANGQHTASSTVITKSGSEVNYFQVPITAGASKISGLATCTNSGNAAPAATRAVDLVKVLVVPAAALLAGAGAFA